MIKKIFRFLLIPIVVICIWFVLYATFYSLAHTDYKHLAIICFNLSAMIASFISVIAWYKFAPSNNVVAAYIGVVFNAFSAFSLYNPFMISIYTNEILSYTPLVSCLVSSILSLWICIRRTQLAPIIVYFIYLGLGYIVFAGIYIFIGPFSPYRLSNGVDSYDYLFFFIVITAILSLITIICYLRKNRWAKPLSIFIFFVQAVYSIIAFPSGIIEAGLMLFIAAKIYTSKPLSEYLSRNKQIKIKEVNIA